MAESEGTQAGGEGNLTLPPPGGRGPPGSARPGFGPGNETVGRLSAAPPAREGQPSADPGWPGANSHSGVRSGIAAGVGGGLGPLRGFGRGVVREDHLMLVHGTPSGEVTLRVPREGTDWRGEPRGGFGRGYGDGAPGGQRALYAGDPGGRVDHRGWPLGEGDQRELVHEVLVAMRERMEDLRGEYGLPELGSERPYDDEGGDDGGRWERAPPASAGETGSPRGWRPTGEWG